MKNQPKNIRNKGKNKGGRYKKKLMLRRKLAKLLGYDSGTPLPVMGVKNSREKMKGQIEVSKVECRDAMRRQAEREERERSYANRTKWRGITNNS